ncbi:YDG domain-containing protein [Limnohabitans sp. Jir72]|uniref:YDG domain-containing protein n=1 Tax=Limnohabitans sp. Jir72 TaxID=1977909 RepID=UPI000D37D2A8|nr:YDG domain-containing protein [Limnohabitans sp. Jir72]PUE35704.1 hypothetical protein B9Z52_00515 [Limnohabitans sp. Jir72]
MNTNCYKTIFSERLGALVAVGEHATATSKTASGQACHGHVAPQAVVNTVFEGFVGILRLIFASGALVCIALGTTQAKAGGNLFSTVLPQGGIVSTGSATIGNNGAQMTINQSTDKASINWQSFSIGSDAAVNITQPSASSVLLNRVIGNDPSQILGKLSANGQVILLNPNGIVFGKDGSVTASAFTASTFGLSDADFKAGLYKYKRNGSSASVVNQGTIETAAGGFVALIGATVTNEGIIHAPQGDVMLVAAENATLPAPPSTVSVPLSKRVRLELDPAAINTAVNNTESGVIVTEGGQVLLQAAALSTAVASVTHSGHIDTSAPQAGAVTVLADGGVIKVDGSITANSSGHTDGQANRGGDIVIGRDEQTGALAKATDVSGAKLESQRGFVETSGNHLVTREVSVKAAEWLLDPSDITISSAADSNVTGTSPADTTPNGATGTSSVVSVNTIQTAINAGTSVTIKTTNDSNTTGAGNITLANALLFNNQGATDASLNLVADNGITQNAGASITTNAASAQRVNVNLTANGNYQGNTAEHASSQGIVLSSTINTNGAVTLTGTNKNTGAGAGVQFGSGASITTPGAVTVTGTSTSGTGYGVALNNTLIDAGTTGDISITGTSTGNHGVFNNLTYSNAYNMKLLGKNVSIHGSTSGAGSSGFLSYIGAFAGNTVTAAGNLSITGTVNGEGSGKAIDHGTTSWQNLVSAYTAGGTLSITGTNASAANTSPTISMVGVQARADGDLTVSATTNNAATDAIFINSSAYFAGVPAPGYIGGASSFVSTGGNTTLKSNQGSILIQDGVPNSVTSTAITGKNVIIDNTGGTFAGGVFTAGSGVSTASGRSGVQIADSLRATDPNLASNPMLRTITATDGGQIVLSGKKASTLGSGVEIKSSAALTAANITINGENTGASGAAINISNGAARLTSTQATTLTSGGVGSGTSLVAAGNISVGTQLTVTNPAVGSISGTISGTGSLLKSGAGQLTLSAYNATTGNYETNTFSGGTTISQGALVIGHGGGNYNKTAGTGAIVVGDLNTGNNNVSLLVEKGTPGNEWGYLTRDITFTNNGTGTATLGTTYGPAGETGRGWSTVNSKITLNRDVFINDATNDRLTLDGQITGTGNITLTGTRITMGAVSGTGISANDFVGNVTISSGTVLQASAKYNLPTTTNVINNGTLRMLDGNHQSIDGLSGSGKVETASTSGGLLTTFSVGNNSSSATYTGTIVGTSSPLNLVKNGTGTQVLAGNNTYAGTTTINAGTLQIGNGGTAGTIGTGAITDNGALIFNRSDNALVVSAKISGTGTVTQAGTGMTTLTANNDWSGSTTISAGTLQIGNGGTTGTLGTSTTVTDNGTLAFNRSDNITADQKITGTGGLTKAGTGTLTLMDSASLNGANNYSGVTTISAGTLQVGDGGTSGHLGTGNIVDNGNLVIKHSDAVTISQIISGSGKLTQSGTGVTTLTGVNTYTGGTDVVSSMLQIGDGTNNGQIGSGTTNIASGATLNFNVKTGTTANYLTSNTFTGTGTLQKTGAGGLTWSSASAVFGMTGGLIDVQAGVLVGSNSANDIWTNNKASLNVATGATFQGVEGNITVDALTGGGTVNSGFPGYGYGINVGVNNGSGTFSGVIQDANGQAAKLTKIGTGTQILTGNNTYTGTTTISAGVLQVGNGGTTGNLGTGPVVDNAALVFNRSNTLTVGNAISGTGTLTQSGTGTTILTGTNTYSGTTTISTGTLQVGNGGTAGTLGTGAVVNNTNLVFNRSNALLVSGAISGTGTLTQMGSGTSTLAADNTYAGTTTVSGGTLQVGNGGSTGTLGAGDVTLSNNATLSYVRSASTTIANTISGAGNVSANITGATSDLTVNRSINLTGGTANLVTDGNLLVKQGISTTNATASAVFLESGKATAAGTATGGDIQISGSGAVTVGSGGRATYMTGSILGSTGMGVLAGNNRYNSDEVTTSYTSALGSGAYAIYREQPLVTVQVNSVSKTYDGLGFSGGSLNSTLTSGALANGDTLAGLTANVAFGGSSQGTKNASATPYVISAIDAGGKNALGYGLTYSAGELTINKANLTITANPVTKTYDGTNNASGLGTVASLAGAGGGDVVNSTGTQAFLDPNAGSNKTVRASGVTIKDAANADMTGNYNITYTDNTSSLINKANLTVTAVDDARFVGRTDTVGFKGAYYTGLVNGETSSVLGGTLAITRTNASTLGAGVYAGVLSPSGLTSGNYSIAYATGNYTIVPANQLLISNDNISTTYGSNWTYNPTAQYLDGKNDTIITLNRTVSGSGFTFSDGAGTSVTATLKPYAGTSPAGLSSSGNTVVGNYSIKDVSPTVVGGNFVGAPVFAGSLSITTKAITPNATGVSKVYDSTTAMTNVQVGLTGEITGDNLSISGNGAFSQKNVGTGLNYTIANIALSGADASNYHLSGGSSSLSGADGAITAAPLVLTSSNVIKTYDGTTSASGSAAVTQNTQLFGSDNLSGGAFTFTNKNAGTGNKVVEVSAVTVNDGNNGQNYTVTYANNTTSTINKAPLTLTANSDTSKVYNGTEQSVNGFAITSGSLQGTDSISVDLASISAGAKGTHAGTYSSTLNDASYTNGNYAITKINGSLFIDQKEVSLAASKIYDGNKTLTGAQLSITTGVGTESLGYTNATMNSKNVADNSINFVNAVTLIDGPNGALANDYKLPALSAASIGNTAVLSAKGLTGSIADVTTTYGTPASTGAVSLIGKIGTDDVLASSAATLVNGTNSSSGNLKAGNYAQTVGTSLTGTDANNYSFAGLTTPTANYVVNKLALTGSIAQGVSVYGSGMTAGTVNLTNKVGSDDVHASGVNIDTSGRTSTSGNLKAGDYAAIQSLTGLNGVDKDNYSFADIKGDYKVSQLALTNAAIAGVSTTYATAADAGAVSFGNVQGVDKVIASASIVNAATSSSGNLKAGSYKQTATTITGDDSANYSFAGLTTTDKNYVVNQLALTNAAIAGVTTTYATAADAGAVSFGNVQGVDKVTSVASIVDAATSSSGNLKAGSYKQTATAITGDDSSNYSFAGLTTTDKNYVVNQLALTNAAIAGVTTTYATAADAGAVSFGNVQGADKVTASASIVDAATSSSGNLKAGSYKQTATAITGDDSANYSFAGIVTTDKNYVVNQLALTNAAIAGVTTTYATAADAGAVSFGNVQGADKVTASASIVDAATSSSGNLKAGSYKQTATAITGDDSANYSFAGLTTTDKNYVVNQLALTNAAIAGVTTTYATAADAGAVSFGNVQGADKVTASSSIVDAATSSSGNLKAGSYKQTATAITGDDSANYSFAGLTTTDKNYVVNKLDLTNAAIAGVTTTYATAADAGAVSFGNVQGVDKVTSVASIVGAATSSSGNLKAGSYKQTATVISGDDSANYSFAGLTTTDKNYVVNQLALTNAAIAGVTTTYATAADAGAVSFGNVQGADKVTASASIVDAATSNSGNLKAGSYKQTATAITGDDSANYSFAGLTTTDKNYVVNQLALTNAAIAGVTTTYATAADAGVVTFSNVQGADKVIASASILDAATSSSGNLKAGSYKQTATAITGDDSANYSFAGLTTTDKNYVVNQLALTNAAIAGVTTTYATAADAGAVSFGNVQGADKVTASASIVDAATSSSGNLKAGSYKQTATVISGDDSANYSFAGLTTTDKNYVVNQLALTNAAIAGVTTTYATAADAGAVSFGNVQGVDKVTSVASIVGAATSSSGNLKAGSYKQTATVISGDDSANYSFAGLTTTDKNYVVNQLALTNAAIAGVTTTYATAADAGAVSFGNVQGADKVTASASIVDAATSSSGNLKAGSYKQTSNAITGDDSSNYSFAGLTTTDKNYVVNQLALTNAAIAGVTTTYATAADAGAVSFGNVQGADKVTASASIVDAATSSSGNLKAGSYKQTATAITGDDSSDYSFAGLTTTDKNYVVNSKSITLSGITAFNKIYDGKTHADIETGNALFNGIESGDKLTVTSSGNFSDKNAETGKTVNLNNTLGGPDLSNYNVAGQSFTIADITPKKVALSGIVAANKTYDGTSSANIFVSNAVFSDLVAGDKLTVTSTGNFSDNNAANGKTVRLNNTFGGADVRNYSVTDQATATANISKKDVSLLSITAANKTYDGNTDAVVISGDIPTGVTSETLAISGAGNFSDKNAAAGKLVTVTDVATLLKTNGTGTWDNYNLTSTGSARTMADIKPKNVTLESITAANKMFDGTTEATITSGVINTGIETEILLISGKGNFSDSAPGSLKTVTVNNVETLTKTNGTGNWNNYKLSTSGAATTKATITDQPSKPVPPISPSKPKDLTSRVKINLGSEPLSERTFSENVAEETCFENDPETCFCEASTVHEEVIVCYEKEIKNKPRSLLTGLSSK